MGKSILSELINVLLGCFWTLMFHHFIMNQWILPPLYNLSRRSIFSPSSLPSAVVNFFKPALGADRDFQDMVLFVIGTTAVHLLNYVVFNGTFGIFDKFRLFQEYKIVPQDAKDKGKEAPLPPSSLVRATLIEVTRTIFITAPLALPFLFTYLSKFQRTPTLESAMSWPGNPSLVEQYGHFIGACLVNHVGFYLMHRAFHHPKLYFLHKQHHTYTSDTISISAEFANPLEQIFANFTPTVLYALLASQRVPQAFWFSFLWYRLAETFELHSGYDFTGTFLQQIGILRTGSRHHFYHHSKNTPVRSGNYGQEYLDALFGTVY